MLNTDALTLDCGLSHNTAKLRLNLGIDPGIFFWRDNIGTEVDIVFEEGQYIHAMEIKSGKSFAPEHAAGLESWMKYAGSAPEHCSIVYAGDKALSWKGVAILSWFSVEKLSGNTLMVQARRQSKTRVLYLTPWVSFVSVKVLEQQVSKLMVAEVHHCVGRICLAVIILLVIRLDDACKPTIINLWFIIVVLEAVVHVYPKSN